VVFYRQEEQEGADPFPLELSASEIGEMRRDGTTMVSSVTCEVEITREKYLPGEYELGAIEGLRSRYGCRPGRGGADLRRPEQRVAFPIVEDPVEYARKWWAGNSHGKHNFQRFPS
jgi:hypothetical protein